jgi:UDP-2,4-diacetamido-2,4,6-trideoxy-beta-L-altropyranose hydrolase
MNIAFRVDASKDIGIGHLMRCLALSEELKKRGCKCYILSKIDDDIAIKKIKEFQVEFQKIKTIDELIIFSKDKEINWIITDCYSLDSDYIKRLKNEKFKVLSIDDKALIHYHSDIVVNQNIGADKLDYSSEKYTKFLLGPAYAIMRDELLRKEEKKDREKVEKILVTLGSSDKDNLILKVLKALEIVDKNIEILAVVGPFNPHYSNLQEFIKKSNSNIKLIQSPENITDIYLESDIAISAGGTSCYELAYFGIPNLIITIANNQLNVAKELDNQEISIYLGKKEDAKAKLVLDKINELINNHPLRKSMSQNGKKLVDGQGKKKIVDVLESF